jgi:hypothetical protein
MIVSPPIIPNQIYLHYKGQKYRIVCVAKHSETLEDMVVYEALYENELGQFWIRPKKMFEEILNIDGQSTPGFSLLAQQTFQ